MTVTPTPASGVPDGVGAGSRGRAALAAPARRRVFELIADAVAAQAKTHRRGECSAGCDRELEVTSNRFGESVELVVAEGGGAWVLRELGIEGGGHGRGRCSVGVSSGRKTR